MAVRNARETISQALFAVVALAFITSSAAAQAPKTLRYAISSFGEENFDPTAVSIVAGVGVAGGMWDWLTEVSAKGELKPGLATSWSQSEDGKSWTLKLRTDVKFHDGSPMTAEDVRFTFMGGFLREGSKSSRTVQFRKIIADVKVVDANTVRLELNSRWPTLPYDLSNQPGLEGIVLPKAYIEKVGWAGFAKQPVGTGPWKFAGQKLGNSVEFTAVKDHWSTPPKFDRLAILNIPEESTRVALLKSGQADVADIQLDSLKAVEISGYKVTQDPQNASIRIHLASSGTDATKPINKLDVRKALAIAINRQEVVEALFAGRGRPASVFPSSEISIGYPNDLQPYPYNPTEAKRLLAQAGFPNGFKITLYTLPISGYTANQQFTEAIAGYWDAIGVQTTIIPTDLGAIRPKYMADPQPDDLRGQAVLFVSTARLNGFDDLGIWWHNVQEGNWRLAAKGEIDSAMAAAAKATTGEEMAKAVSDAYRILYNNYRSIPVVDGASSVWAYGNQISGVGTLRPFRGFITPNFATMTPK